MTKLPSASHLRSIALTQSLTNRILPAAAIALAIAFLPIIACSRANGSSGNAAPQSDRAASAASGSGAASPAGAPPVAGAGAPAAGTAAAVNVPVIAATPNQNPADAKKMAAAALKLGKDPGVLLARVARTRYELYPGVFRGAVATLADGAGNDYDRSVLLHDLLAAANRDVKVRYAFCTLSAGQSAAAVAAARQAYVSPRVTSTADALAAKETDPKRRQNLTRFASFWKQAVAQERQQATELAADFQKAGAQLTAASAGNLQSIAADHVWVQAQTQGTWMDLDPGVPQAKPGATLCVAARTAESLPDAAFDVVTAVLRLESRDGSQEHDATLVSGAWRTADLAGASLAFAFAEPSGLHASAPQPAGMLAYTPLLIAGPQTISAAPIVVPEPQEGPGSGAAAAAGASAAAAAFGDKPQAPAAPVTPPAPVTPAGPVPVALRLDVAVAAPNVPRVSVERPIFDRISAADRAAGRSATAPRKDFPLYSLGTAWDIAINLGTGVAGAGDRSRIDYKSKDPAMVVRSFGRMQRGYYLLRRAVFADALGPSAPPVLAAEPGLSFVGFAPQPAGIEPFGLAIDRAVEGAGPQGGDAASSLAWAVASVYGERLAIAMPKMLGSADKLDTLPFDDAIEMFYIARHGNNAATVVRSGADVERLGISDDAKTRLSASIAGGASAVVPASVIGYGGTNDSGWWVLRPDGRVSDEMQSGMHHSSLPTLLQSELIVPIGFADPQIVEYAQRAARAVKNAIVFGKNGSLALCSAAMVSVAMAGGEPEAVESALEAATATMEVIEKAETLEEAEEAAVACEIL